MNACGHSRLGSVRARSVAERFVARFGFDLACKRASHLRERIFTRSVYGSFRDTADFTRHVIWVTMYRNDLANLSGEKT